MMIELIDLLNTKNIDLYLQNQENFKRLVIININSNISEEKSLTELEALNIHALILNKLISIEPFFLNKKTSSGQLVDNSINIKYRYQFLPACPKGYDILIQITPI